MRRVSSRFLAATLGVFTMLTCGIIPSVAQTSSATTWPQRTVHFIVTLGPGSGTDIGARLLADRLTKRWAQSVVVENRPGGDGIVAISGFVTAQDDHVLLFAPTASFTAHPYLHNNLPYKPSDLAPIARVSNTFVGITVPNALPVSSLPELAALVRQAR
jgi:tripartite-type tricarboxylate transporter receptor subunit TctC